MLVEQWAFLAAIERIINDVSCSSADALSSMAGPRAPRRNFTVHRHYEKSSKHRVRSPFNEYMFSHQHFLYLFSKRINAS